MMHLKVLVLLVVLSVVSASPLWKVFCDSQPIYRGRADPIVTPGALSGHSHKVFGGNNFDLGDASLTPLQEYNKMMASSCTSCSISIDKTAYWVPDLYYQWPDGSFSLVPNGGLTVYYPSRTGSGAQSNPKWQAFPKGFRMLAGSPTRRTFNASDNRDLAISYACLGNSPSPQTNAFPADISQCVNGLRAQLWFPMCWDGVNLDSPDHKSHMSYPIERVDSGNCPPTHPVRFPGVFFEVLLSITAFPKQNYNPYRWSVGDPTGYGFHGDFLSGWDQNILQAALGDSTCDSTNTNNGNNVLACKSLAPYVLSSHSNCTIANPIHNIEDLGYNHPIEKLPGCNPVTPPGGATCAILEPSVGPDWRRFLLQNKLSTLFVGAKDSNTILNASVQNPSMSEVWTMVSVSSGQYGIKSDLTGKFVTSPRGGNLICNKGSAQSWETFVIALASDKVHYTIFSLSNSMYVSLHSDGSLHSDSSVIGNAQLWQLVDPGTFVPGGSSPSASPFPVSRAVSEATDSYPTDNASSSSASSTPSFPYWVIGIIAGVVVVVVVIIVVIVNRRRRTHKMESV